MTSHRDIIEAATELASILPASTVQTVADAILKTDVVNLKAEIAKRVPHHHHRDLAFGFVDNWQNGLSEVAPPIVSVALQTASITEQKIRDSQSVELVWTGPDTGDLPFRRTEQAILQVLDSAEERITLVSFAVYRIPNIAKALVRAAQRGVQITVIVETPSKIEGAGEYSTLQALGDQVAACSTVYYWPQEKRELSRSKKYAILHVKCAVADGERLFLSSANLTEQAFTINMELGMLVRGGTMPSRVEKQFMSLIKNKVVERVD